MSNNALLNNRLSRTEDGFHINLNTVNTRCGTFSLEDGGTITRVTFPHALQQSLARLQSVLGVNSACVNLSLRLTADDVPHIDRLQVIGATEDGLSDRAVRAQAKLNDILTAHAPTLAKYAPPAAFMEGDLSLSRLKGSTDFDPEQTGIILGNLPALGRKRAA